MINSYRIMEEILKDESALEKYAYHDDWRVRYAAAVAMGETKSDQWMDHIFKLLKIEEGRNLYSQPKVKGFENSYDDTRMAEQLVPIKVIFDKEYPEDLKEDWKCRGRVRQACLFAIYQIGKANEEMINTMYKYITDPHEDHAVKAASAMALGTIGDKDSIPYLEKALLIDEWCLQTEARKAIKLLSEK